MVIIHVFYEDGREIDIFTVESRIETDVKNAGKDGKIETWTVESL